MCKVTVGFFIENVPDGHREVPQIIVSWCDLPVRMQSRDGCLVTCSKHRVWGAKYRRRRHAVLDYSILLFFFIFWKNRKCGVHFDISRVHSRESTSIHYIVASMQFPFTYVTGLIFGDEERTPSSVADPSWSWQSERLWNVTTAKYSWIA